VKFSEKATNQHVGDILERLVYLPRPRRFKISIRSLPPQGYRLRITAGGPQIEASDDAGKFYAAMTLRQIRRQCGDKLPVGEIEDWPDFPVRGVMLDISRDKVPTMETLFRLVDEFAEWKINHLELYTEHTFAYRNHRAVWEHASPMTGEEIERLDAYCRERFIELVPNQNSFGHFERWLKHPQYQHLVAGSRRSCLDPSNPASLALLDELYGELLPHFTSRKFNVGCDETYGIEGEVYLGFLLKIHELVTRHGRRMHFWGDIVSQHPSLPEDVVVLQWGYEAEHAFQKLDRPFYVCPGTSSWSSIAGRTDNCLANLRNAAACPADGYLITDWGDNGHWQYLPVSYLGFAAGAALAWGGEVNIVSALNTHVFRDAAGIMGRMAYDLGNAYLHTGKLVKNATSLFHLLREEQPDVPPCLAETREYIQSVIAPVGKARMQRADARLIQAEFVNAARLLLWACDRGGDASVILAEHRRLWLARSRPGGLPDSLTCLRIPASRTG
jgi:hypothetical protein